MIRLYDYWRSGAGHRVRIALALKGIAHERIAVDLRAGAQREAEHRARNPQGFVPLLEVETAPGAVLRIPQSLAILEWLEEVHPAPPLLPADPAARARARAMAAVIASDVHPLGNLRVLQWLRGEAGLDDPQIAAWALRWIGDGFATLEAMLAEAPGPWAHGESPGLADCCIAPQIYAARSRYGFDIRPFPKLAAIAAAADAHPAFIAAHPERQADCA